MKLRPGREFTEYGDYGVRRNLRHMVSGPGVFWSLKGNSYVACRGPQDTIRIVSINGIGEIRWTVEEWNRDTESNDARAYFLEAE